MTLSIPNDAAELSAPWLTAALRQWGGAGDVTVATCTATPLVESMGFFGQLARVRLTYDEAAAGAPTVLIAKFASPTPEMRQRSVDSYAREVRFYQQLAPTIELSVPTCYYADLDLATGEHILLLQDLAPLQSGARVAGCTPDQARLAIDAIVKLHVTWWGRTDAATLNWLADGDVNPDPVLMRQQYEQWWPAFYAQAEERLPAALIAASEGLGQQRATIRRHIFGSSPRTLIHRDFQADNLFFDQAQAGQGTGGDAAFAMVDWQFLSRGRGVWDVAYFLSESMATADRRAVEMELLARYHRALVTQGIGDYSFEQCLFDYRMALLLRHTALVSTIAAMPFSAAQRQLHLDILLPRNIAAILDHDAFEIFS